MPLAAATDNKKRERKEIQTETNKPKVPPQHKSIITVSINNEEYEKLYETLRQLGYKNEEAIDKVKIAIQDGFTHETDIIKYILSLNDGQ